MNTFRLFTFIFVTHVLQYYIDYTYRKFSGRKEI